MKKQNSELKPLFVERMKEILPDKKDFQDYIKSLKTEPKKSIRCNTLKISSEKLKERLKSKGWKISQPFQKNPEIMIVEGKYARLHDANFNSWKSSQALTRSLINKNCADDKNNYDEKISNVNNKTNDKKVGSHINNKYKSTSDSEQLRNLEPGELGRTLEHLLGYYYVQEISSMMPVLALKPKPNEIILDLCASPGSKTTQIAAEMKNAGTLIANEISLGRVKILASNTERCGVTNMIITKKEGAALCRNLKKIRMEFDKILIDAPCSGEGTLRISPATCKMWNINTIKKLSKIQKNLLASAIEILKPEGEIVYSTCTHAPEENEEIIDFALNMFKEKLKIEKVNLPIKYRNGITKWRDKIYSQEVKKCARIYPQDNNTEGFFIAKLKKIK